jgi:hypothetical protein
MPEQFASCRRHQDYHQIGFELTTEVGIQTII